MRFVLIGIAALVCFTLSGCIGGHTLTAAPRASHQVAVSKTPVAAPAAVHSAKKSPFGALLKTSGESASSAAATPTTSGQNVSPLSCVQQHLHALQEGKIFPGKSCS